MILPILGVVEQFGKQRIFISGMSSDNGFALNVLKKPEYYLYEFAITDYDPKKHSMLLNKRTSFFLRAFSFLIILGFLLLTYDAKTPFIANLFYYGFAALVINSTVSWLYLFISIPKSKDLREWHSCEHKSVVLLEAELEPTVENLEKCPAVLINCGTVYESVSLEFSLCCLYALSSNNFFQNPGLMDWLTIIMGASCFLYMVFATVSFGRSSLFLFLFWLPCVFLPLLAEKFCSTKNPSKEKLNRTVQELKVFLWQNRLYK